MVYSYKTPYIIDAKIQTGYVRLFHYFTSSSLLTLFTFKFIYIFIILFEQHDKRWYTYNKVNKNIHSIHSLHIHTHILSINNYTITTHHTHTQKEETYENIFIIYNIYTTYFHDTTILLYKYPHQLQKSKMEKQEK